VSCPCSHWTLAVSWLFKILGVGQLADLVERMLRSSGPRINMSTPFVDAMLPDGSRLHVIPDVTRGHMTVIARRVRRADIHRCV
jgi:Flp pilus assembly CpaF family ATPase